MNLHQLVYQIVLEFHYFINYQLFSYFYHYFVFCFIDKIEATFPSFAAFVRSLPVPHDVVAGWVRNRERKKDRKKERKEEREKEIQGKEYRDRNSVREEKGWKNERELGEKNRMLRRGREKEF